ncbi:MAG: NAD(P)/FAD-dependent oxidoreductase [Candidatus Methylomirabilales bacterium]
MSQRRIVIVGNSAAGLAAVEAIRRRDDGCPVTLVGEEARPAYSRVMLPYLLSGEREDLSLRAPDYYRRMRVEALLGRRAVAIDGDRLVLDDGARLPFDRLLLATGSRAAVPDIPGVGVPGVFAMKTMADALAVRARLPAVRHVVILGGGLICLLVVRALLKQGRSVSLVVSSDRLLSRLLDPGGAAIVHRRLAEAGVQVLTRTDARAILASSGTVCAVVTGDGRELPADLVILAKGIRSDVELAKTGGLATGRGILVDEYSRTSRADVFAAGDCAEAPDLLTPGTRTIPGNWFEAVAQGEAAGANMLGAGRPAPGALKMNVMEAVHTPVASIGMLEPPDAEAGVLIRERNGTYRKLVMARDRIVGAALVGDVSEAGLLAMLIRQGASLSALKRLDLSRPMHYASLARG